MSEQQELPDGWVWTTLGEAVSPVRESTHPMDYPTLPYIGMEHIEAETMRLLGTVPATEMKSNALLFQAGDVLYGRLRPYLNKVIRPSFAGLCSPEFIVFPGAAEVDAQYLQYFLNSWAFKDFATHLNTGDRPRVDWEQIKVYPFPLAPLAEQQRIVAAIEQHFTRLDAGIAALKRAQATLKRYRASVLKAAVEGRLTEAWRAEHPDAEPASQLLARILAERRARWEADMRAKSKDPAKTTYPEPATPDTASLPALPDGWVWATLGVIADIQLGKMLSPKAFDSDLAQRPYLRNENVRWGRIDVNDVKQMGFNETELQKYQLLPEDLLVCEGGEAGRCAVYRFAPGQFLYQKALHRVRFRENATNPHFIQFCFQHYGAAKQIIPRTSETTIQHLPQEKMEVITIPLPSLAEQEQIVAEVERHLSVIGELEQIVADNLKRAERLRQSILREAFAGRLVPQNPTDEPASVLLERIRQERKEREKQPSRNGKRHQNGSAQGSNEIGQTEFTSAEPVQPIEAEQAELWQEKVETTR